VKDWLVPAYTMPPDLEHVAVLRVVVRNGFSRDLARMLVDDLHWAVGRIQRGAGITAKEHAGSFHH